MKKHTFIVLLTISILSLHTIKAQDSTNTMTIQPPESFVLIDAVEGDLDKDGIPEKVIIYDTDIDVDLGTERHIYIYKIHDNQWELWLKTIGAVLPSLHGGMMGDPFVGVSIERNCIVIDHFGGSRQKWEYSHRYRFQNGGFKLIGATVHFGSPCDYFFTFDYNLSTGKADYEKEIENCEDEEKSTVEEMETTRKLEILPAMEGFYPGNNEFVFPDSDRIIYY